MKIQTQLIAFVCTILLLVGLASAYFANELIQSINLSENIRKISVIIDTNSKSVTEDLISKHTVHIQNDFFDPISDLEEIEFIYLTDFEGKVFLHTFQDGFPENLYTNLQTIQGKTDLQVQSYSQEDNKNFAISKPLIAGMKARVFIGINNNRISSHYRNILSQIAAFIIALTFIAIGLAVILAKFTTAPLEKLVSSIQNFGKSATTAPLHTTSKCREINDLAEAFNTMATIRNKATADLKRHQEQLEERVQKRTQDLQKALSEVKTLSAFLPICASCKKIRDDQGDWNQIESYIKEHTDTEFSHSICPECALALYPSEITRNLNLG